MTNNKSNQELPQLWELLNKADRKQYQYMRLTLSSPVCKNRRNHSAQTFLNILNTIKTFAIRNDSEDWTRCFVCGIFWLDNNQIAVNSKQLCLLLSKCKSSINGSFQFLGYLTIQNNVESVKTFLKTLPVSKTAIFETRQWTIRQLDTGQQQSAQIKEIDKKSQPADLIDTLFPPFKCDIEVDCDNNKNNLSTTDECFDEMSIIYGRDNKNEDDRIFHLTDMPDGSALFDYTNLDFKDENTSL